jgi:transaldolase
VLYVETLIGPDTVNTMPLETLSAFREHGHVRRTVDMDMAAAHQVIRRFEAAGFSLADVTAQVLKEGVEKFNHSLDQLLKLIDARRGESTLRKR